MRRFRPPLLQEGSLRAVVTAGAIMAASIGLREALDFAFPDIPPFVTLFPAVALASLLCGPWSGGFALMLGALAAEFLWMPPRMSFALPSPSDCIALALFAAASMIIIWASAFLRRELAEADLARRALDLALAAGGVGIFQFNLRSKRITASRAAHALHFVPPGNTRTTGEDWLRPIHPEDRGPAISSLRASIADGTLASYTYRVLGPAALRWISARGQAVESAGEQTLLVALIDVTDQVRAQEELKRERERLRLALEAGTLAVWDYDPETREILVDARYAALLGLPPAPTKVSRAQIGARIHPHDLQRVIAEHDSMVQGATPYMIEYRIITPDGQIRWLVSQAILLEASETAASGRMVGIIQDITDRKRREEEARALAAAREVLVREADHRIKNSLQLVIALLSVQLRGIEDPAAIDALRGAITRVGAIAASHLALQGSDDLRHIDFALTLKELCGHLAALQPNVAIICRPLAEGSGDTLMLDADRAIPLALAVSELLTNALRHAFPDREAGTITVDAAIEGEDLRVRVTDDGIGVPPSAQSPPGLGSRIIRALAERIAATIEVESAPGAGTTVTIRLKLGPEAVERRIA